MIIKYMLRQPSHIADWIESLVQLINRLCNATRHDRQVSSESKHSFRMSIGLSYVYVHMCVKKWKLSSLGLQDVSPCMVDVQGCICIPLLLACNAAWLPNPEECGILGTNSVGILNTASFWCIALPCVVCVPFVLRARWGRNRQGLKKKH